MLKYAAGGASRGDRRAKCPISDSDAATFRLLAAVAAQYRHVPHTQASEVVARLVDDTLALDIALGRPEYQRWRFSRARAVGETLDGRKIYLR